MAFPRSSLFFTISAPATAGQADQKHYYAQYGTQWQDFKYSIPVNKNQHVKETAWTIEITWVISKTLNLLYLSATIPPKRENKNEGNCTANTSPPPSIKPMCVAHKSSNIPPFAASMYQSWKQIARKNTSCNFGYGMLWMSGFHLGFSFQEACHGFFPPCILR